MYSELVQTCQTGKTMQRYNAAMSDQIGADQQPKPASPSDSARKTILLMVDSPETLFLIKLLTAGGGKYYYPAIRQCRRKIKGTGNIPSFPLL